MSCARYVGYVGALAVALGIGMAFGPGGEARADNPGGQASHHSAHHRAHHRGAPRDGVTRG
ncbi:MAG TPA: PE-PPE domain-containing protein, partial [Mycobacterium sp.]|nr:PE-PPE domain-containing protein [Mycobacterium sp.]